MLQEYQLLKASGGNWGSVGQEAAFVPKMQKTTDISYLTMAILLSLHEAEKRVRQEVQ